MLTVARLATRLADSRVVLLSGLVFAVAFWLVNVNGVPGLVHSESLGRIGILDMDYGYPPEHALRKLAAYGSEGRAAYRQFLTHVDFLYPAVVGWFFCSATLAALRRVYPTRPGLQALGFVPLLLTAADWAENSALLGMLADYPTPAPLLARVACGFTLLKVVAGIASLVVLLYLELVWAFRWSRSLLTRSTGA
jgi:hypothetical protein